MRRSFNAIAMFFILSGAALQVGNASEQRMFPVAEICSAGNANCRRVTHPIELGKITEIVRDEGALGDPY